ncbi:hypothetical protein D187_008011 [Cystobacter fuscus DSM 2262]|uniref:Lipoprotein n=1 Tax=Cystobacter fuscus (strain ATCC 25194 / DSM 2262 / NBRC 100088 / M29) TaxID=1242864 RepID=S9Q5T8_CYSF2|nr:hypothetical protein [Cystobacter fuscus]EPX56669.1 hypothetical protein D187_008011 [Cystobacter fuscus DSM 2262]
MRTYSPRVGRTFAALLIALLLAAPAGCRKPAQPSEAYVEAQTRFGKLYAARGDDAFVDPELAAIEGLLAQVPTNSLDAPAANELRARIEEGKQQARSRQRALDEVRGRASQPAQMPAEGYGGTRSFPSSQPTEAAEAEDAGTDAGTAGGAPGVGTPATELASGFSGCFKQGESLQVQGRGQRDRWDLSDSPACRQQFAALQDQVLIIEEGKVLALVPKQSLQAIPTDGGTPSPAADAGR